MKKFGFTLAEVLITLGIIGAVAALTLPQLTSHYNTNVLEKQTLKSYNTFSNAIKAYLAENEADTLSDANFNVRNFVTRYLDATPCQNANQCFANSYLRESSGTNHASNEWYVDNQSYRLADGTTFSMDYDAEAHRATLTMDVNGTKGPNMLGYDLWQVAINNNGRMTDTPAPNLAVANGYNEQQINQANAILQENYLSGFFNNFVSNGFKFDY